MGTAQVWGFIVLNATQIENIRLFGDPAFLEKLLRTKTEVRRLVLFVGKIGEIEQGEYDKEIKEEKTVPSEEKKTELDTHFKKITEEQEAILKKEADEKQEAAAKEETEAAEGAAEGEKKEEEPKKDAKK